MPAARNTPRPTVPTRQRIAAELVAINAAAILGALALGHLL